MIVQHNITAMNANRQLGITNGNQAKATEKLSSGYRINRAGDDAAGLTISEKMRSQIRGLNQASTNAQDGVSLIQTAEGALNEAHSILQRMNELAVKGANDTNQSIDRDAIQQELTALTSELDRIADTTQFNKQNLIDGSFLGKKLQVGANQNQFIDINIRAMDSKAIGLNVSGKVTCYVTSYYVKSANDTGTGTKTSTADSAQKLAACQTSYGVNAKITTSTTVTSGEDGVRSINVSTYRDAVNTVAFVQDAINFVSDQRSALGALQNRLEHTIANLDTSSENASAAESRVRDVDMATEMVEFSKNNILAQAGQAMLAQANQSTQGVLSLLG